MSKLHDLHAGGQSVWLDFIRRDMLESGELAELVEQGIRGLTSNPTIFQQAIGRSDAYDAQIRALRAERPDAKTLEIFEELAVADIRDAADVLSNVYYESGGTDGFVSLEVSPHLAHDTGATIAEAQRLWAWVDRPNLMIKVPATDEGVPAVEELIAAGLNINVTLLFSLDFYVKVARAYIAGLARAANPASIASVASFFVSRVDTSADAALDKVGSDAALALRGTIAVANAKLAYRHYRQIFESDEFSALAARGGRPQRVLWASTSTKNPEYDDVLYVDELVGPNTVNTMPPATIDAFVDHGTIDVSALTTDVEVADEQIATLRRLGVDFDEITADLLTDGVSKFAESFDDLLATLEGKIGELG